MLSPRANAIILKPDSAAKQPIRQTLTESPSPRSPLTLSSDCASLPNDLLESQITELAGHLNAANHRLLVLIAEFDRREAWGDSFTHSCAHWLNWKCGIDLGAAREKVRVARALEQLPQISSTMARGALSYSKVRALTRVATPATEGDLLMIALHGTAAHVERLVRSYRRAEQATEQSRERQQFENRKVSYYFDDDGSLVLQARLPAEVGAALVTALERAMTTLDDASGRFPSADSVSAETSQALSSGCVDPQAEPHDDPNADPHADPHARRRLDRPLDREAFPAETRNVSQRRADALGLLADSFIARGLATSSGGDRHQIVVHVDAQTLVHETAGRCELEAGPTLSAQTARRLGCDCSLVTLVEAPSGQALDAGRKTRSIPPSIRRALRSRDSGCRFPGCTHTHFLDGHHIQHWADGGHTKLSNLVLLCRYHHRMVHEGGVSIERLNDGALRFIGPEQRCLQEHSPVSGSSQWLVERNVDSGFNIDADTAVTLWRGERLDYDLAVGCLMDSVSRARRAGVQRAQIPQAAGSGAGNVSAET